MEVIKMALEPISRGLFYAMLIVIGVHYPVISIPFAAAVGLFFVRWWLQTAVLNVSARRMGLHRFSMWSVLWFDITLPLVNLYMLIVPQRKKNSW